MSRTHLMLDIPTNLIVDPEDFSGAAWALGGDCTVVVNTDTAPDGTLTADSLSSDATEPYSDNAMQDVAVTEATNAPYTYSFHVKKETTDDVQTTLYLMDDLTPVEQASYTLDLESGSITYFNSNASSGPGYSQDDVTVETVSASGGDYWRISYTLQDYSGTANAFRVRHYPNPQGSTNPARTVVLWGAQLLNRASSGLYYSGGSVNSATLEPQFLKDERGAFQVKVTGGDCNNVKLQGSLVAGGEWEDLKATEDMGAGVEPVDKLFTNVALVPLIRVRAIGGSSDLSLLAYVME